MAQLSTSGSSTADGPSMPPTPQAETPDPFRQASSGLGTDADGYMRTWIAPDLSNLEYLALLKVFPAFVMRNPLPRFPMANANAARVRDLEEGGAVRESHNEIKVGTGTMWIGGQSRRPGWQGSWWIRFKLWLRTLFC